MLFAGGVGVGAGVLVALGVATPVPVADGLTGGSVAVGLATAELAVEVAVAVTLLPALELVAVDVPSDGFMVQAASGSANKHAATSTSIPDRRARRCR